VFNTGAQGAVAFAEIVDMTALLSWLHRDALLDAVCKLIDDNADDAGTLSHEDRQKRAAVVRADLLAIERQESALVWKAQAERLPVEHRADVDPLALLSGELVVQVMKPSPGSSPGASWELTLGPPEARRSRR
jgi:hypothetical protein